MGIYDVPSEELIKRVAAELEKNEHVKAPEWAPFVRTSVHKERQPTQDNWWHLRSASILRKLFMHGPIGVNKLRIAYGGRKNRGHKPERFYRASGNILRTILQQLEKAGLAKQAEKDNYKGRIITPQGHALLESVSTAIIKDQGIEFKEKPKEDLPIKEEKKAKKRKKTAKKKTAKKTTKKTKKTSVKEAPEKTEEKKTAPKEPPQEPAKAAPAEETNGKQ